jgi:hypothetical protein
MRRSAFDRPGCARCRRAPASSRRRGTSPSNPDRCAGRWSRSQIRMPPLGEAPAFVGEARRALERFLEADRAEALQQRVVAGDRAGHGRRVHAAVRHALDAELRREELGRPAGRRPAAGIQRVELLVLRDVDEREQIAADAGVVLRGDVRGPRRSRPPASMAFAGPWRRNSRGRPVPPSGIAGRHHPVGRGEHLSDRPLATASPAARRSRHGLDSRSRAAADTADGTPNAFL